MYCQKLLPTLSINIFKRLFGKLVIPRKRANRNVNLILNDYQKQALIGLALGDIYIEKPTTNSNVRLVFDQSSSVHSEYLYFLYDLFKIFVLTPPKETNRKADRRTKKIYNSLIFKTRMLPCFNFLWELFYKDRKKVVPNNISELLTPVGLAFWIMDDGSLGSNGQIILSTLAFSSSDIDLLIEALQVNFNIKSSKTTVREGQWQIVIPKSYVSKVKELTLNHFHKSMLYKLGHKD